MIAQTGHQNGIQYVCAKHAQVIRNEPGFCSVCGAKLEPTIPAEIETWLQAEDL